jgi:hypothetical protein
MRTLTRLLSILTTVGALVSCAENAQTPVTPKAAPSVPHRVVAPDNAGQTRTYLIRIFAHGHAQTYRLSVDHSRKTLDFLSVNSPELTTCDDPTLPGCTPPDDGAGGGGGTGVLTGDLELTGEDSVFADLSSQNLSADLAAAEGPFHCPGRVDDPHFEWKGHHFQVEGEAPRIPANIPQTSGIPKGRYLLPPGPWLSDDGRARIWSGTIDGTCFVFYTLWAGVITTEEGAMSWYGFHGDYEKIGDNASFASNGGQYGGVVYYSLSELQSGDPEAYKVIMAYINDGTCTDGWVIVIDGERKC